MRLLNQIKPEVPIRIGLGLTYLYSGIDILRHPSAWHWAIRALPEFVRGSIDAIGVDSFLIFQGSLELIFGLVFLSWFLPKPLVKWLAIITALEMLFILFFTGLDSITFRDMGIMGGALALFLLIHNKKY